ncbi:MAG: hypothetical protein IJG81_11525, partial [Muribaculaceae bacterium]|nr:hypothetical protein [Muribaculaceae bacterium]
PSKDQAATIYDGLAWSYTQSRVFDPPSIFDAHAAQGFVLACPIAENKKNTLALCAMAGTRALYFSVNLLYSA